MFAIGIKFFLIMYCCLIRASARARQNESNTSQAAQPVPINGEIRRCISIVVTKQDSDNVSYKL
jgi:hypothetical protein